jgi:hypothetical protein
MNTNAVTIPGYIDYFRTLAVQHRWLLHNPLSENADSDIGEKHFTRWSVDEVVTSLRSKVGWPALLLEMFEIVTRATNNYDVKGFYTGAFTVLDTALVGDTQSEIDALAKCETIVNEILRQIWQDHHGLNKDRCQTPFTDFYFDSINITPVGPLFDNQYGLRVEFQFKPKHFLNVTVPPEEGVFITSSSES